MIFLRTYRIVYDVGKLIVIHVMYFSRLFSTEGGCHILAGLLLPCACNAFSATIIWKTGKLFSFQSLQKLYFSLNHDDDDDGMVVCKEKATTSTIYLCVWLFIDEHPLVFHCGFVYISCSH